MHRIQRYILLFACSSMALSICLGAFGAHALSSSLSIQSMKTYQTAVQYQIYHALGLFGLGILISQYQHKLLLLAACLLMMGVCFFSGSLYVLILTGVHWVGILTPIGGCLLILGWLCLALSLLSI